MNESEKRDKDQGSDMDDVGQLIRKVGPREAIDPQRVARSYARVAQHFQHAKKRRSKRWLYSIAASLVAAVCLGTLSWLYLDSPTPDSDMQFATVTQVIGEVTTDGTALMANQVLDRPLALLTGENSRIGLALANGQFAWVDEHSSLLVQSAASMQLDRGAVYIDSDYASSADSVRVATPLGVARDVGTRFQVAIDEDMLTIGVRDGLVEVHTPNSRLVSVDKGHFVQLNAERLLRRDVLHQDDPSWDWVDQVTSQFNADGRTLYDFLRWYARLKEKSLHWSDESSEELAKNIRLHGDTSELSAEQILEHVNSTTNFSIQPEGEKLWLTVAQD